MPRRRARRNSGLGYWVSLVLAPAAKAAGAAANTRLTCCRLELLLFALETGTITCWRGTDKERIAWTNRWMS